MARIKTVAKAQKDQGKCRRCGAPILAGSKYYWFANRIGRSSIRKNFCAAHYPKASEVTTSDKLSQIYSAQEDLAVAIDAAGSLEDLSSALRDAAGIAQEVAEAYRESISNMPESFQNGSQAEEMEEKASQCEDWASALESAADEVEGMEPEEPEPGDICAKCTHAYSEHKDGAECEAVETADSHCECEEFEREDDGSDAMLEEARSTASSACEEQQL
jgi:hypothetical protein